MSCTATSLVCVAQEIANIFSCVRFCICKFGHSKGSLIDTNPHLDFCSPPPLFPLSLPTFPPQSHRSFTFFLQKYIYLTLWQSLNALLLNPLSLFIKSRVIKIIINLSWEIIPFNHSAYLLKCRWHFWYIKYKIHWAKMFNNNFSNNDLD